MQDSNTYLSSDGPLTALLPHKMTWHELLEFITNLPYGRNSSRYDHSLVLTELRGSCSSKHAVLKMLADENGLKNIELVLCMYKMQGVNTMGVGEVLSANELDFIPEAHCYLRVDNLNMDCTTPSSNISRIENDIMEEQIITPDQVAEYKVEFHRNFMERWLAQSEVTYTFEELWEIREKCIEALSAAS